MKLIRPATINSTNLTSNVPEVSPAAYAAGSTYALDATVSVATGTTIQVYRSLANSNTGHDPASSPTWWKPVAVTYAEYSGAVTYALGGRVISATTLSATHHVYESLTAGNLGNALTDATKWLDLGPTNKLAMFDQVNGTQTVSTDNIDVTAAITGRSDGIGLFGMTAESVQITVSTASAGTIYDQTFSLVSDSGITDWYSYFTEDITYSEDLVLTDLPLNSNPNVRVQIKSGSGAVACGTMVLGQTRDLGVTTYGAKAGIQDYSKKSADEFGNYQIVPRAYAKRTSLKVSVDNDQVDAIYQLLANLRTTPCVWVGADDFAMTWSFGFWKDVVAEITTVNKSSLSLEIEGLT